MMAYEYDGIRPDIVLLGKALSGGRKSSMASPLMWGSANRLFLQYTRSLLF